MKKVDSKIEIPIYSDYFQDCEIRNDFKKEFISLWPMWLGKEKLHELDEVTETNWKKFNSLIRYIFEEHKLFVVNFDKATISKIDDIENTLASYDSSMNKSSSEFSAYVISDLDCVLTEDWDYTFILWYKNKNAIEKLDPIIKKSELYHFS